ncbi:MAG TPA: SDR family oxidoreductase [Aeromicrobium sp.]|nr:SDR family oxidoreductase [Aeromicrobium sp.]
MTDVTGRHFLVTGANTGIGKETARGLAKAGGKVTLAGRSEEKTRAAIDDIRATVPDADLAFVQLDLADLDSVRGAAAEFLARDEPLDVLINNAGLAGSPGMTASGFEMTFGTNYVGPFLFTQLLLDRLKQADAARIVNVASTMHYQAKGIDWDAVRKPTTSRIGMKEYSVSKLANVVHAQELARRLAGTNVTTYSLHPGVIASDVYRKVPWPARKVMTMFMKSTEDGAKTSLYCATSPDVAGDTGLYYDNSAQKPPSSVATPELAAELWSRTEDWLR